MDKKESTFINPNDGKIRPSGVLTDRALLIVLSENLFGQTFVLSRERSLIGRGGSCDVMIEDPLISREHCLIEFDGGYYLQDLGSKNGTVLNRKPLSRRTALYYGDRIVLGDTILRFLLEERVERK